MPEPTWSRKSPPVLLLAFGAVAAFTSCQGQDRSRALEAEKGRQNTSQLLEARLRKLSAKIGQAQGTSRCNQDSDCRIKGLGTRMCGEFKDYLVYSSLDAHEWDLAGLVEEFNSTHSQLLKQSLSATTCGTPPARVACVAHHCEPVRQ